MRPSDMVYEWVIRSGRPPLYNLVSQYIQGYEKEGLDAPRAVAARWVFVPIYMNTRPNANWGSVTQRIDELAESYPPC